MTSFQITHQSSAGHREAQTVRQADAPALMTKLERVGASNIEVIDPNGHKWTLAQAREHLA